MKIRMPTFVVFSRAVATTIVLALAGCGGGGGGSGLSGGGTPPPVEGVITGTVVKGPVNTATITAYDISNGSVGSQVATGTTDAQGAFRLTVGSHTGPFMLQASGGTYTDEASGSSMPMLSGDVMSAMLTSMTAGATVSGVQVTPLTSMAQAMSQHMSGGMSDANITSANGTVGSYFMVSDILHNVPINPLTSGSGTSGANQDSINYGMTLAAMSQYAQTQGMSSSSAMVTAMQSDATDGVMDGMMSGSAVMMGGMGMGSALPTTAGTTGIATAMSAFTSSAQNHSGVALATMQTLINKLNGSNGQMMGSGTGQAQSGKVSGRVFNGNMEQGTVTAYAVSGGVRGPQVASTAMGSNGTFSMSLGTYSGPLMLRVTSGTFTDEATGTVMQMGDTDVMTAAMASIASGAEVQDLCVTALTSMAQARAAGMSGGMTDAHIASANAAVGNYFMLGNILTTQPIDMMVAGSGVGGGITQDQMNYGAAIAAMSEYAHSLGMSTSSAFVTAMMQDAGDGMMDGKMGGSQIQMGGMMGGGGMGGSNMMQSTAGTSGLATAMTDFMDSAMDHSGLTSADMNALIQHLASSNGAL